MLNISPQVKKTLEKTLRTIQDNEVVEEFSLENKVRLLIQAQEELRNLYKDQERFKQLKLTEAQKNESKSFIFKQINKFS